MKYEPPSFKTRAFTCPYCGVYALFVWEACLERMNTPNGTLFPNRLHSATCGHCTERTIWLEIWDGGQMLWPQGIGNAPLPHQDMPEDVKNDYVEARNIIGVSPRGAAALLRLAIQKLCVYLGGEGKNINDDISTLVKSGLPVQIQQALDIVRVTGNNAVHPGELRLEDNPEIASALFGLVNLIVDNRIAEPERIKKLYETLPSGAKQSIAKRDV